MKHLLILAAVEQGFGLLQPKKTGLMKGSRAATKPRVALVEPMEVVGDDDGRGPYWEPAAILADKAPHADWFPSSYNTLYEAEAAPV
eukprot:CAMPEP_0119273836 /NCGR_PEP_ID=MMETSP1329-20130426/10983_1 /TAXON_ID=114041 /ORGANISM="Genus nov. species nov., Strain RCC1024" /LENGTH=86 /DNA_ID=CAMNT_0007274085 /DNA_START=39 /DNA_END=296 /DNA_ORIENTATION=-